MTNETSDTAMTCDAAHSAAASETNPPIILSLAPMEGVTGHVYRQVHAECFGGFDRYYTPFLSPRADHYSFNRRDAKEADPSNNSGLDVTPQILTNKVDDFLAGARQLADRGYTEINLNLGCPSGTVVSKGKGSGFLRHPAELEDFLRIICSKSPLPLSIKTRIGVESDDEYEEILDIYCRCPLTELIVHPRVQKDFYKGKPRWEPYGLTLERAPFPVAYNGNVFTTQGMDALLDAYPQTRHVMIGRGALTNPALPRQIKGGPAATSAEMRHFHNRLFEEYAKEMGDGNAVSHMKEWWSYTRFCFEDPMAVRRAIRKTRTAADYQTAVSRVFREQPLSESPRFQSGGKL